MLIPVGYICPVCASSVDSAVDPSQGDAQRYVEDCQVCCRPLVLHVTIDGERASVVADSESD